MRPKKEVQRSVEDPQGTRHPCDGFPPRERRSWLCRHPWKAEKFKSSGQNSPQKAKTSIRADHTLLEDCSGVKEKNWNQIAGVFTEKLPFAAPRTFPPNKPPAAPLKKIRR